MQEEGTKIKVILRSREKIQFLSKNAKFKLISVIYDQLSFNSLFEQMFKNLFWRILLKIFCGKNRKKITKMEKMEKYFKIEKN